MECWQKRLTRWTQDEIVLPQSDPNASAFTKDVRGVGVSNVEIQSVCGAISPDSFVNVDHEGVLYNALGYALAVDSLKHGGPGQLSRIDVEKACSSLAAPGLSLSDMLATHATIPLAVGYLLAYTPKASREPPIMPYAQ